jgi:hypothetical protein
MAKTGQGWAVVVASALSLLIAGGVGARAIAVEGVGAWAKQQPVDPTGDPKGPVTPITDDLAKPVQAEETAEQVRDGRIEKQVEARIERNPALKGQGLDVTVTQGKVTLTGTTATDREKATAARLAKGVRGVSEVENQILVRGSPEAAQPTGERTRPSATPPGVNHNDTNTGRPGERGKDREKDGRDFGDQTGRIDQTAPNSKPGPATRSERTPTPPDQTAPAPRAGHGVPAPGGPTPPLPRPPVVPTPIDPMPPGPSEPAAPTAPAPTPVP